MTEWSPQNAPRDGGQFSSHYRSPRERQDAKNARERERRALVSMTKMWIDHLEVGKSDECWHWLASFGSGGYPQAMIRPTLVKPHRLIAEIVYGEISGPVHHACGHRWCLNPLHLLPTENTREHWRHHTADKETWDLIERIKNKND